MDKAARSWRGRLDRRGPLAIGLGNLAIGLALALLWLGLAAHPCLAADSTTPAAPTDSSAISRYRCGGDPLEARIENGAVDAVRIPNSIAGTPPGAFVVLRWRGTTLQLPRTNNAGAPSFTDGRWWWSLEDPEHPRLLQRRATVEAIPCSRET